ncbi:MAG TPA: endonuclease domain-containing protein [Terriglobales bacterium]|nr:endonuclease domain-containing protein [Terriglobales bacterium]
MPIFYFGPGTRCRGCESRAKHSSHVRRVYGANGPTYEKMYQLQDGRCAVCGHRQKIKRLALDHNHQTGEKRGLLCQWCNDQVIGSLGTTPETQLRAARALVEYLERPPASGEWSAAIRDAAIPHPRASAYTDESPPPF